MKRTSPKLSPSPSGAEHAGAEILVALATDPAASGTRHPWSAHLRSCAACRRLERGARSLALALGAGALEPVPEALRRRALRLPDEQRESGLASAVRKASERVLGVLRWVERPAWTAAPALAGVRAAEGVTRCELVGRGYRLELEWLPAGRTWTVRGRVLGPARAAHARLVLERERARAHALPVGARGFFGPLRGVSGRVRARLETGEGHYLSAWFAVPSPSRPGARKRR